MAKILGKGDYRIELSFYAHGEWHKKILCKKTLKGAYVLARIIQHNYSGANYYFYLIDYKQCKLRWFYQGETSTSKWCNIHYLRNGQFDCITGYKKVARG